MSGGIFDYRSEPERSRPAALVPLAVLLVVGVFLIRRFRQ